MLFNLTKYKQNHFFFTADGDLAALCNAPKNAIGVYIVYELKNGKVELVYIGSSGKMQNNGKIKHRDGGLYDRIVNGKQFGELPRKQSWKQKLIDEKIEALDVYWYDTFNSNEKSIPAFVEANLIQQYFDLNGCLPRWNKEF